METLGTPEIYLGCMFFGTRVPQEQAFGLLDRYVEAGGRWLDTANNYAAWEPGGSGDESEELLGRWLAVRGIRDDIVLATKVGARARPGEAGPRAALGLSAPAIREQVDGCLRRLAVQRIDLMHAHIDDRTVPLAETLGALDELVRDGKVRAIACSNLTVERLGAALAISAAAGQVGYSAIQLRATYLTARPDADFGRQVPIAAGHLDLATEHGMLVTGYSALLAGAYDNPDRPIPPQYRHRGTDRQLAAVRAVAAGCGATASQVVFAWLRAQGVLPVLGVSRPAQLDEALAAASLTLEPQALTELDAARVNSAQLGAGRPKVDRADSGTRST
jgi:aryl-alcohol dehydrogenase-like predicted oxidoreductase